MMPALNRLNAATAKIAPHWTRLDADSQRRPLQPLLRFHDVSTRSAPRRRRLSQLPFPSPPRAPAPGARCRPSRRRSRARSPSHLQTAHPLARVPPRSWSRSSLRAVGVGSVAVRSPRSVQHQVLLGRRLHRLVPESLPLLAVVLLVEPLTPSYRLHQDLRPGARVRQEPSSSSAELATSVGCRWPCFRRGRSASPRVRSASRRRRRNCGGCARRWRR